MDSLKNVDWVEVKDTMFTAGDQISDRAIDVFLQSKDVLRELKDCSMLIGDAAAADNDTETCIKAKKYYTQMQSTVSQIKAEIDEIEQDENATPERKKRAAELKSRILEIEEIPMDSAAIQGVYSVCLFILAWVFIH